MSWEDGGEARKRSYEEYNNILQFQASVVEDLKELKTLVTDLRIEVAELRTKAKIGGFIAGTIPAVILFVISLLISLLGSKK